jgi:hypothetical protein
MNRVSRISRHVILSLFTHRRRQNERADGEPVGSVAFTNGFAMLQIGKALVEKDPAFANPDRKND